MYHVACSGGRAEFFLANATLKTSLDMHGRTLPWTNHRSRKTFVELERLRPPHWFPSPAQTSTRWFAKATLVNRHANSPRQPTFNRTIRPQQIAFSFATNVSASSGVRRSISTARNISTAGFTFASGAAAGANKSSCTPPFFVRPRIVA